ncbi:Ribulosamine/erythrulosamine 3-kinase potentially involved in protein deglycation [Methylophaga frappieri]|uniref:Ribulosamine/erythrulosamine 3-kinase potentially involved in protein deglycation n=1 Tax=Methylophaga frappieri (strain ATCC BAA-2434 / DSM 25690 / JAM7) TaxID=754477 RepID=I1YH60_METFJ|nr:fructosamine kinase family protein [Methylophaga frappieri]AFJ02253.1 Ribulosamine/erythrulosamine 3-kinase potentially involved in protein deglycation [Methylophaga frappieri]
MTDLNAIITEIELATGENCQPFQSRSIGGGCINTAYLLETPSGAFFVKVNRPDLEHMFTAEAQGLNEMAATESVRVPQVICSGRTGSDAFLVLEYIALRGLRGNAASTLGEQLAHMHTQVQPYFGWLMDNTIGSTPQPNDRQTNWVTFWQQYRLGHQYHLASRAGFASQLQQKGEQLIEVVADFFTDYQPEPALLHGDLWGGNAAADEHGQPVIFDPACYYGDAEADLAMTELFGSFGSDFYAAYRAVRPIDSGYQTRKTLYNLYHILNHLNLFGGGYLGQAQAMTEQLLAEVKG